MGDPSQRKRYYEGYEHPTRHAPQGNTGPDHAGEVPPFVHLGDRPQERKSEGNSKLCVVNFLSE